MNEPPRGVPKPVCSANRLMLKFIIDVEAFTKCGLTWLKFAGWFHTKNTYLHSHEVITKT